MAQIRFSSSLALIFVLLIATGTGVFYRLAEGVQRRIHITDDLDDVVDDEEDEAWREWGKKKSTSKPEFDPPPDDFSNMDIAQMQSEMLKRQVGPVFGFAKLRIGPRRTPDMVSEIAMKWSKLARTGGIQANFMGVDVSTIMFSMEKGQDTIELKEFVLSQPDAYEVKIGDQFFRRPGDPSFDEVFAKYRSEKSDEDRDDEHSEL